MVGEGNRTALPIWGYFFEKVYADKTLGISKDAKFVQPESMRVETFMDYENFAEKYRNEPDAENPDAGNGTSADYGDLKLEPGQNLGPESQLSEEEKVLKEAKKEEEKKPEPKKEEIKTPAVLSDKDKKATDTKKKDEKKKNDPKPGGN